MNRPVMTTLIFATNNKHKVAEIQAAIGADLHVISLAAAGLDVDIPEPYPTLEENARTKSQTIYTLTGQNCFSEDTGLEVPALGGAPGVKSARFAGDDSTTAENNVLLLQRMQGQSDRKARFRTVISLIWEGVEYQFEGICEGHIREQASGEAGFGYDPLFEPLGSDRSFAEMSMDEKNKFSHRKKAAAKLVTFLQSRLSENP